MARYMDIGARGSTVPGHIYIIYHTPVPTGAVYGMAGEIKVPRPIKDKKKGRG